MTNTAIRKTTGNRVDYLSFKIIHQKFLFIRTRPWKFLNIRKVPVFGRYLQVQMPKKATFRIQIKRFFHICFHEGLIPCPFITKLTIFFIHSFLHTSQTLDMQKGFFIMMEFMFADLCLMYPHAIFSLKEYASSIIMVNI